MSRLPLSQCMSKSALLVSVSQGLSSASNFLLIYFASRSGSLSEVASLSIALLVFGVGTSILRNGLFRRAIVGRSSSGSVPDTMLAVQLLAVTVLVVLVAISAFLGDSQSILLVLAVAAPFLYAQDAGRQRALLSDRFGMLLLTDGVWLVVFLFLTFLLGPDPTVTAIVVAWAAAGALGAICLGSIAIPTGASFRGAVAASKESRVEVSEVGVLRIVPLLAALAVAAIVDFEDFGAWSGIRSYFGPLTVLYGTMSSGGLMLLARTRRRNESTAKVAALTLGLVFPGLSVVVALVLRFVIFRGPLAPAPDVLAGFEVFLWPVAVFVGLAGIIQVLRANAHAAQMSAKQSFQVQLKASVVGAAGLLAGAPFGMITAAWGAVIGAALGSAIWLSASARKTDGAASTADVPG